MDWKQQGKAVVGALSLPDGRTGRIVLMAPRSNPKGAVVVLPIEGSNEVESLPMSDHIDSLEPKVVMEILCMQERIFGPTPLPKPLLS